MAELHVPGVSVAVLHGGKLDWARGFGVKAGGRGVSGCGNPVPGRVD